MKQQAPLKWNMFARTAAKSAAICHAFAVELRSVNIGTVAVFMISFTTSETSGVYWRVTGRKRDSIGASVRRCVGAQDHKKKCESNWYRY